ncbi:hypothetical protein [Aliivibrio fischeri]|uniref:hypothetical protein n=1 Tax=Aliivibrio fischeri TaxID=668 RepID=UPI0007C54FFB|nr:hypothetical protein [Aliivibrio fischeri]
MKIKMLNGNSLYTKSMRRFFEIKAFSLDEEMHKKLQRAKLYVCVAEMPFNREIELLGQQYQGDSNIRVEDKHTEQLSFTYLYVKTQSGDLHQVSNVCKTIEEAQDIMLARSDVFLIDSTALSMKLEHQLHFLASKEKSIVSFS